MKRFGCWTGRTVRAESALLLLCLLGPVLSFAVDVPYQIKASYIYNILQFVTFPEDQPGKRTQVRVCVLGEDRFGPALDEVRGAPVPQGSIEIERLGRTPSKENLNRCDAIYFVDSEANSAARILQQVDRNRVLTIGEFPTFIRQGGLIEIFEDEDRIRFRVNPDQINATGFKLDAQLVQLGVGNGND